MSDIQAILTSERKNKVRWGFIWAIICAVFWGLGYVPLTIFWGFDPIGSQFGMEGEGGYIFSSLMLTAFQIIFFGILLAVIWSGATGKIKEYKRVITNRKAIKWLLLGAICGGPIAIMGNMLTTGYIGAGFAAAMALMSTVMGALLGRIINHEKLSKKAICGILVMLVGGILILNPQSMIADLSNPSSDGVIWGYIGAIMSIVGWGFEGNIAVRTLDVTDADVSLPVRFSIEGILWILLLLPATACIVGFDTMGSALVECITSVPFVYWMIILVLSLGFCYAAQYKAFPLIGVGRTLSLNSLYVPISLIALFVFLGSDIGILMIVGTVIAVVGVFIMYWESDSIGETMRGES